LLYLFKGNVINNHVQNLRSRIQANDNELNNTDHFRVKKPFSSLNPQGAQAMKGGGRTFHLEIPIFRDEAESWGAETRPQNELLWRARRSADGANQGTSQSAGLTRAVGCYPDSNRLLRDSSISKKKRLPELKDARCHASPRGYEELKVNCKMVQLLS